MGREVHFSRPEDANKKLSTVEVIELQDDRFRNSFSYPQPELNTQSGKAITRLDKSTNAGTKFLSNITMAEIEVDAQDQFHSYTKDHVRITNLILNVLESYFWDLDAVSNATTPHWKGKATFMPHVLHWVSKAEPVRMMLPAFPFKSSNADKVLGVLPDFGEYLALARLNQLCLDIRKVYDAGGETTIATDGVAFSDIYQLSDATVWRYGEALREMVCSDSFDRNLKVVHTAEFMDVTGGQRVDEHCFLSVAGRCRRIIDE